MLLKVGLQLQTDIAAGTEEALNQLVARVEGELTIAILPIEARTDPNIHNPMSPCLMKILSHTPTITKMPPREQPIFMPNRSRIQLVGKANMGLRMEKMRTLRVMTTGSMPKFLLTIVLMLENVWFGSEFTRLAKKNRVRFTQR